MDQHIKDAAARLHAWIESTAERGEAPTLTQEAEQDLLVLVGWVEGIVATEAAAEDLSRVMRTSEFLSGHDLSIAGASETVGMMIQSLTPPSVTE